MFKTIKPNRIFLMAAICLLMACKTSEEPQLTYPADEVPVQTESDEAMQEFIKGLDLYDQGNPQKARPLFDKALALDPNFVSAQMYRAFCSSSAKEWAENRDKFLAMREKGNEGELLWMDMLVAGMEDNLQKGTDVSMQLTEKYPKSARAFDNLAGYYNSMDETAKARETWAKAMELNPDYIPAISALGASYLFTSPKDFTKAQGYMEMVVEKKPESSQAQISLGDCYRAQNDLNKALASYLKAAELDPTNEVAFSKAGHANSFLGNMDAARKNYQDARAVSEFGTGSINFEAYTYLYEGDHEKALAFLQDAANDVDQMDIPESNKTWTKMGCAADCAVIAMHYGDSDHLNEFVEKMKPLRGQMIEEIGANSFTASQQANMHYWEAMASATAGNFEEAAATAELIKADMESSDDPNKLRPYHRVHAFVNYQLENYEKALEHMAELDQDNVYNKYWMAKANKMTGNDERATTLLNEIAIDNFNSVGYALILNETKEMLASNN